MKKIFLKFILFVFLLGLLSLSIKGYLEKTRCGDGVCQNWESKRGSCTQDCLNGKSLNMETSSKSDVLPGEVKLFKDKAGPLSWSHQNNSVVFSRLGSDGYFDLWITDENGDNEGCLSCNHPDLPNRHMGQPVWHPSGDYIVFQAQQKNSPKLVDSKAVPGAGSLNDLWIMTADGKKVWSIYEVKDEVSKDSAGVLHAHFSHDGEKIFWAERIGSSDRSSFGEWRLKLADFRIEKGQPQLSNIQTFNPGGESSFFESHSFSPDDNYVLFTGDQDGPLEIYEMELATSQIKRLTIGTKDTWDEHAHYSPDGKRILWVSSQDLIFRTKPFELETEFWIMNRDGTNKQRLTYFNQSGHEHYVNEDFAVAADADWSGDGEYIIGLVLLNDFKFDQRGSGKLFKIAVPHNMGSSK
jgi:Tol biopolymer transport system component